MDHFHALTAFVKVVETGSFARAADRLDRSVSAISRSVADLEAHLGARLLNRTTRRLSLTETGQAFHERAVQLLADLEEAEAAVGAAALEPRGTLKITCATTFATRHLAAAIAAYAQRFPRVRFNVELSDRFVDLVEEGFDLAIRVGAVGSPSLIARRIGTTELLCCASTDYLARHGEPRAPEELAQHACLTYAYAPERNVWRFTDAAGALHSVAVSGPVHSNNGAMLTALGVAGLGVHMEPDFIVAPHVRAGRLVRILRAWKPEAGVINAVYPSRRHLSTKVRTFIDFLVERFADDPPWRLP